MKLFIVALLVGVAYAEVSLHAVFQAKWSNFKATHGKTYQPGEEQHRLNAFLRTSLEIEQHNERFENGLESYSMGHNQFSDMTSQEMQAFKGGMPEERPENMTLFEVRPMDLPGSVDWRGHIPAIKNQGSCGSCYTFAAVAALEGAVARRTGQVHSLSEQNALDCSGYYGNMGCNGGWSHKTFNCIQAYGGLYETRDYPYVGRVQQCQNRNAQRHGRLARSVATNSEAALTQALATVGPVAVSIESNKRTFMNYAGGIYSDTTCGNSGNTDHLVTVVGYGVEGGVPYYRVRNSWGTGWGEQGHIRMRRSLCLVHCYGCYPVVQ